MSSGIPARTGAVDGSVALINVLSSFGATSDASMSVCRLKLGENLADLLLAGRKESFAPIQSLQVDPADSDEYLCHLTIVYVPVEL
eukprot:scaffold59847_cov20-Prasinocladus_malaysianus.AAC.1